MTDAASRKIAASPLARPKSRRLGEPEFARIPDNVWSSPESERLLVVLFLGLIFLPLVAYLRGIESGQLLDENRHLAPPPNFATAKLAQLPEQIDAYYGDWFGFRRRLIRWQNTVRHLWLGASSDDLRIGKQGWAFYAREGIFENHLGLAPFTETELASWQAFLEQRHNALAERGVKYIFVVAPDKPSVYPEMLPDFVQRSLRQARLDQLITYLRERHSPVTLLDLRPALIDAKREGLLYFPQDTHWNGRGLFVGMREIIRAAQPPFLDGAPLLPPNLGIDYRIERITAGLGDWNLFGLAEENLKYPTDFLVHIGEAKARPLPASLPASIPPIREPWNRPLKFVQPSGAHSVLVIHDSFMRTGVLDRDHMMLAESFRQSVFIGIKARLSELVALVNQEHPELVVEERVERQIAWPAPVDPPVPMK